MAEEGRPEGVDFLLAQPTLSPEAQVYYDAWEDLADDRMQLSHSLGMAGGMLLHQRIGSDVIRRHGRRLGYLGDGLADFVVIVRAIDRIERAENFKRQVKEIADAQKKNNRKP